MRVNLGTVELTDEQRRAINWIVGKLGMATRDDIRRFFVTLGEASIDEKVSAMRESEDR